MPHRKRIPANDKVPFERWEMPDLTGVRKRIAQRLDELEVEQKESNSENPPEPQAPTPEEIQALREEAHNAGYAAGFEEGKQTGHEEGKALGYQEGEAQGQEAGFQSGYQQGLEQAQHEVDQQLARLQSLIEQLQGPLQNLDQEVEAGLLSLVDLISRAILRREIGISRDFLGEVLREAVTALPSGHQRLRIYINPQDQQLIEAVRSDLLEENRVISDPQITPGGVRVETLQSLVDSTLENRYKKVIDSLLDAGYQEVEGDLEPLSRDVLAEPEATPPQEPTQPAAEETQNQPDPIPEETAVDPQDYRHDNLGQETDPEPESEPESEPEPQPEPVAKVSLQRSSAPRNLPPLDEQQQKSAEPSPNNESSIADPSGQESEDPEELRTEAPPAQDDQQQAEPEMNFPESNESGESTDPNEASEPDEVAEHPEKTQTPEYPGDQPEQQEIDQSPEPTPQSQPQPPLTDEDEDDFFDQVLGGEEGETQEKNEEAVPEPEEKVWAPESVHEVRYLEDPEAVMESTWKDDFQDQEASESEEDTEEAANNPEQALDDLMKFDDAPEEDASTQSGRGDDHG
ncbi:FliH/SctL family protein [Marinospirillum sp.]|uniref:FliH/SctL family protein n=1 Tax=Marinospirillum sp. TaxID=2183934 RepID=UPI00286FEE82|nr:FliH/SctL family protein [Marinospirillum sp.]MDR9466756.1 FliH/SctL family protein [Marinospirillum sp.]